MIDQSELRRSSPQSTIGRVSIRPHRMADLLNMEARRGFLVLLASGVAINAWALFPSTDGSGIYLPRPNMSATPTSGVDSVRDNAADNPPELIPANAFRLMGTKLGTTNPKWRGPVEHSVPVVVITMVPLRSKLQALLILLESRFGDEESAVLVTKLRALLELPDSALVAVLGLPEMAVLSSMVDAVAMGKVDLPGLRTELSKIQLTSAPETPYQIEIAVNGKPMAKVDMRYVGDNSVGSLSAASLAPTTAPAGFVNVEPGVSIMASAVTLSVLRSVEPVDLSLALTAVTPEASGSTFVSVEPKSFAPTVAPETFASTFSTVAPEPFAPETPVPTYVTVAPEIEPSSATSTPEEAVPTQTNREEAQGTTTSDEVNDSGNKFEPGSAEPQSGQDRSPATDTADPTGTTATPESGGAATGGDPPSGGEAGEGDASGGGEGAGGNSGNP